MDRFAAIFPGQGTQEVGMGSDFISRYSEVRLVFEEASERLEFDLQKLCLDGPAEKLGLTQYSQPAIQTLSCAIWKAIATRVDINPSYFAGHSLGEYSALVCSGSLKASSAAYAVHVRGRLMQEATPVGTGGMAAILGSSAEDIEKICAEEAHDDVVAAANYNSPGQVVVSGHNAAVDRVLARLKGKKLAVSAPFHCSLMKPAADKLRPVLAMLEFDAPAAPVVSNYSCQPVTAIQDILDSLYHQVYHPVLWDKSIKLINSWGIETFVEIGHGKVLSRLNKRIVPKAKNISVSNDQELTELINLLEG